jgi:hypothetical protein
VPHAYGPGRSVDLVLPATPPPHPVVAVVGGPAGRSAPPGFAVAGLTGPAGPYPGPVEDAGLALRWLRRRAGTYGLDPTRVVAMGTGAAGWVAVLLGLTQLSAVHAVVALIGSAPEPADPVPYLTAAAPPLYLSGADRLFAACVAAGATATLVEGTTARHTARGRVTTLPTAPTVLTFLTTATH